jgi:hypothetical protein
MARERRKGIRVEWNSSGLIFDDDGVWSQPCVVQDLSNGGAKINSVPVSEVPDRFMLRIARGSHGTRKCRVLWRSTDTLGVTFTDRLLASGARQKRPAHSL